MISNPVRVSIDGTFNGRKTFTYEGGSKLYHFCPHDNGLSTVFECNVIFAASNETHALNVLARMLRFLIEAHGEALKSDKGQEDEWFKHNSVSKIEKYMTWLLMLEKGHVRVEEVTLNQFFKVGWADNDTV